MRQSAMEADATKMPIISPFHQTSSHLSLTCPISALEDPASA